MERRVFSDAMAEKAAENLRLVREKRPLVHNITNDVVMNFTANALLASGASPVMAYAQEEVEEMVSLADALVLNMGTLTTARVDAMEKAGKRANALHVPVALDPLGAGATSFRTLSAKRLMQEVSVRVIRGNASEILSLVRDGSGTRGVESIHQVDHAVDAAVGLARERGLTLAVTGKVDVVTEGLRLLKIYNGHSMMGYVTGTGCVATAMVAAFLAVDSDPVEAAATALSYFGLAGEKASEGLAGPGTFQVRLLDALYSISEDELRRGAKIESGLL
jgi:hydroxyethylthiazole kinase